MGKKVAGALAALALAGGLLIGMTGTARADVVPPTTTWVEIVAGYLDQQACLDDPGGSNAVGDQLELWHCHGYDSRGSAQRWNFVPATFTGPNQYALLSEGDEHCLGPVGGVVRSGVRVQMVNCNLFDNPYWTVLSRNAYPGDPAFELQYGTMAYCMTMPDWSGGNAEPVLLRPCQPGNGLQLWNIG
jgi:hypothetical protein